MACDWASRSMRSGGFFRVYCSFLFHHPLLLLVSTLLLSGLLPLILLALHPPQLTPNAEIGFDTKGTSSSGQRQAWQQLSLSLQTSNRLQLGGGNGTEGRGRRSRRGWGDDLLAALSAIPCYDAQIPLMNHLSQVVVELPSFSSLFDMDVASSLCEMKNAIAPQLRAFDSYTPYRSVWSLPVFASCLSPRALTSCSELSQSDLDSFRSLLSECLPHREKVVDCRIGGGSCKGVPSNCSSTMMADLFYRILPLDVSARPLYINNFLPVFTLTGYATQNIRVPLQLYDHLEEAIANYSAANGITVRGLLMDVKRDRLVGAAIGDSFMALVSALLVLLCVVVHSRSIGYSVAVGVQLCLAVAASLAIYSLFTLQFPLLNLVTFVLLIAIASDDAFLLHSALPDGAISEEAFEEALIHTGGTMFLTSFSTAVPFYLNCFSEVVVFRAFGLFAGTTVVINYLLVISFLPAFVLLHRRFCTWCPLIPSMGSCISRPMQSILPSVILHGRLLWMAGLSVCVAGSVYAGVTRLHLPDYNPLQLFVSSNRHEWYDNHAQPLFAFVEGKVAIPLTTRLVFGLLPVSPSSHFDVDPPAPLHHDSSFSLSSLHSLKVLADRLASIRALPFVQHPHKFWPERFLEWAKTWKCVTGGVCCDYDSGDFQAVWLDFCLRNSTAYLATHYNDTPLFDQATFEIVGYTATMPTSLRYSHRFSNLSSSMATIDGGFSPLQGGWWTTEWYLMSTWFDLQRGVVSDCVWSLLVSLAVVAVFAMAQMRAQSLSAVAAISATIVVCVGVVAMLGWVIGLLEAVILVLIVGLSFDYTLHYGASLPDHGCPVYRISTSVEKASVPVSLAAISSLLAGAPMLLCKTHAFFQVGVFLVVLTSVSWIFSTFFFLPLLSLTLGRSSSCPHCKSSSSIALEHKF